MSIWTALFLEFLWVELRYFWIFADKCFFGYVPFDRPLDATLRVQGTGLFGVRLTRDWRGARSALQSNGAVAEPRKARGAEGWAVGLAKE